MALTIRSTDRLLYLLLALALPSALYALDLPETSIAYEIEVSLEPDTRMLDGRETIRWTNLSSAEIERVPVHLYLNGFSHEDTTWMRSVGIGRVQLDRLLEVWRDPWGWIEPRSIRQGEIELSWQPIAPDDGNPNDRSLIEIALSDPVPPGGTLELDVEFEARLPIPIARTGGYEDFFFVAQWFPKISVLETVGVRGATEDRWVAHQFHGPTEFYADYADFDVRIGVPTGWAVAATGKGGPEEGNEGGTTTWHRYRQRAVHDFAFTTGDRMVDVVSTHQPQGGGGPVEIHIFVPEGTEHQVARWREATEGSLDVLGSRVGPYPYETITVVFTPFRAMRTLGMEYPTLFTGLMGDPIWDVGAVANFRMPEEVIAHEFVHQYFYGIVGTNEFEEAFLDEGFTQYWGAEAMIDTYGDKGGGGQLLGRPVGMSEFERSSLGPSRRAPLPVWTDPSYLARGYDIAIQFYYRPATILRTASGLFGRETMDEVFALYYRRWAFRHPGFEDFLDAAREAGGDEVAEFLLEAFTRPEPPDYRVAWMRTEAWSSPRGRIVTDEGVVEHGDEIDDDSLVGLDPAARETDGTLLMEILDPGSTHGGGQQPGCIERRAVVPDSAEPDDDWEAEEDEFHFSAVRIEGPAWRNLPVEVRFRFADGAVVSETWDGRAHYRTYKFLRAAPLSEVRLDPEGIIAADPDWVNNAEMREADDEMVDDWSMWLGGLFQVLMEGMSQWL